MGREMKRMDRIESAASKITLLNDGDRPFNLLIEQELDQCRMSPGDTLEITKMADADIRLIVFDGGIQLDFVPRPMQFENEMPAGPSLTVRGAGRRLSEMRRSARG